MTRFAVRALSTTLKFPATALSYMETFHGHCIIQLTGAAISVKRPNGNMVASWPYNCIRQFRAEDETGTFSFLSGRRGPFGVAEYIFELQEPILTSMQDALTQFTGAQFMGTQSTSEKRRSTGSSSVGSFGSPSSASATASSPDPGSQSGRRPLPYHPSKSPMRQVMSVSQLSLSSEGEHTYQMSRFAPTLPRYQSETSMPASPPVRSATGVSTERRSPSREPWELKPDSYASVSARPILFKDRPLPPSPSDQSSARPRWPPRVETLSNFEGRGTYVTTLGAGSGSPSSKRPLPSSPGIFAGRKLPPSPTDERPCTNAMGRRDSEMSDVFSTASDSTGDGTSPLGDYSKTLPIRRGTAPNVRLHTPMSPPHDVHVHPQVESAPFVRQQTAPAFATLPTRRHHYEEADVKSSHPKPNRLSDPESRSRPDPYDHLHLSQETNGHVDSQATLPPRRSQSYSPEVTSPQETTPPTGNIRLSRSTEQDFSNLDFVPRGSPHVQTRTITPEFAQHLAKFGQDPEKVVNLSSAVKGKRSPENMKRRAQTLQNLNTSDQTYDSPRPAHPLNYPAATSQSDPRMQQAPGAQQDSRLLPATESLYQSPRSQPYPQVTDALYTNVPSSQQASSRDHLYEDPREQIIDEADGDEGTYHVPRPRDPNAPTNLYQVPPGSRPRAPLDTYDSPRSTNASNGTDGMYNVPRSALQQYQDSTYSIPRVASDNALPSQDPYNVPPEATYNYARPNALTHNNLYNIPPGTMSRQVAASQVPQYEHIEEIPPARRLRPARSFESLFTRRVNQPEAGGNRVQGRRSPEVVSTKSNPYVDIDLNRSLPMQRNPLPAVPPSPESENLYAEIPDNPRVRYIATLKRRGSRENLVDHGPAEEELQHSLYHVPRALTTANPPQSLHGTSPQSPMYAVIPGEGEQVGGRVPLPHRAATISRDPTAIARDLAHQGYELCLPSDEVPPYKTTTLPHGFTTSPPRNLPRTNYKDMMDKFGRQIPNGVQRPRFQSDQTDQSPVSSTELQPSSVPDDASVLSDEYVIITRSDPREKTSPKDIPAQPERRRSSTDEYEVMSAVHVKLAMINSKSPSPIREIGGAVASPPSQSSRLQKRSTTAFEETVDWRRGSHAHTGSGDSTSPHRDNEATAVGVVGISPVEKSTALESSGGVPRVLRTQTTADGSGVDILERGRAVGMVLPIASESVPVPQSKMVRIAAGSPNDRSTSIDLRNRSRSFGNFLDRPRTKPHTYVNMPKDQLETREGESPSVNRKPPPPVPEKRRPLPLPRKSEHKSILLKN